MKKNESIPLTIERLQFPHKGIGYYEGEKVTVPFTLPGQKLQVRIVKKRKGTAEGRLETVLAPSPLERRPACSQFGVCGGCTYQQIGHEDECKLKEAQVLELLEKAGIRGFAYEGIVGTPKREGYRNKCEFSFGDEEKDGPLALGMRKRQSYYEVASLGDCNIVDADFRRIVEAALAFFREKKVPFFHKRTHEGCLRHLVVRKGEQTGELLINLVTTSNPPFSLEDWKNCLLGLKLSGTIVGVLHSVNNGVADVASSEETTVLYGREYLMERLFDLQFRVSAYSFFQTNTKGAEVLYGIVRDFAGGTADKIIYDLYCGTGTIGQIMAAQSKWVYGIEIVEEAVAAAQKNAELNRIHNCTFLAGDVLKLVETLPEKPDLIIVDPPREGIHPKAIGKVIGFGADEIVYVSCKPTSLARDLQVFQENGYAVRRLKLVNQFPRTSHVESVVLLQKTI